MVILSIDPGIERIGYAVFHKQPKFKYDYQTSGLIKTDKKLELKTRLYEIYTQLKSLVDTHRPDMIVLEQLFFFKNAKTVVQVSQAQGVILLLAAQENLHLEFLTPLQIKSIITGYGNADKKAMQKMVSLLMPELASIKQDDQVDAIACGLAFCHLRSDLM
jgi:crossover junction endodeoxyribonuclease RuvC